MKIPYVDSKEMAKIDKSAISSGLDILQMMENAGRNLARFIADNLKPKKVILIFGKGNNGGGGLVAARYLSIYGIEVEIISASREVNENIKHQLRILENSGIYPKEDFKAREGDVVIDALLGYNIKGDPKGRYADLIRGINFMRKSGMRVVSLDLPSGSNPDENNSFEPCVKADFTLTLALPKKGLRNNRNAGKIYLANIGIPTEVYSKLGIGVGNIFKKQDIIKV